MIIITQVIVTLVAIALLIYALTGRQTHVARAWKKIGLSLLAVAMVVAVIFPDLTNRLAHLMGIGRGADLLLYMLTLAFIIYVLNSYLSRQNETDALYRLARKVALLDAEERYKIQKQNK